MGLEAAEYLEGLVENWPLGTDFKSVGAAHMRLIKKCIQQTFPDYSAVFDPPRGFTGEVKLLPLDPPGIGIELLLCDGTIHLEADFPALAAILGAAYGGDGITDFGVPDYRGRFLRGTDQGAGVDPGAAARTARPDGVTGDAPGTLQADDFRSHTHSNNLIRQPTGGQAGGSTNTPTAGQNGNNVQGDATGGSETRPVNIYSNLYILT